MRNNNPIDLFQRIPLQNLKTFTTLTKTKSVKLAGKEVILRADSNLFEGLLIIAQSRLMDIQQILQFELRPLPWSLATTEGQLQKTVKSKLFSFLKVGVSPLEHVPGHAAWMVDAMVVLQSTCNVC